MNRKTLASVALAGLSALEATAQSTNSPTQPSGDYFSSPTLKRVVQEEPAKRWFGSFDTAVVNSYTPAVGFKLDGGEVIQSFLNFGYSRIFRTNDSVTLGGWSSIGRDFKGGLKARTQEVDLIAGYSTGPIDNNLPILESLGGSFTLSGDYQEWFYPNGIVAPVNDRVTDFQASWTSPTKVPLTLSANWRHLFEREGATSGDYLHLIASAKLSLGKIGGKERGWDVALTPEFNAVPSWNFFLPGSDVNLQPMGTLSFTNPKGNVSIYLRGGYNFDLERENKDVMKAKPDQGLFRLGATYNF